MAQIMHLPLEEGAFAELGLEALISESVQHNPQLLQMLFRGWQKYNNVVKVQQ